MEFDDFLTEVGDYGMFQTYLLWLVLVPAMVPYTVVAFTHVFMVGIPLHWCKISALDYLAANESELRKKLSIPMKGNHYEKCLMYDVDYNKLRQDYPNNDWQPNSSWPITSCHDGWEYDHKFYEKTLTTDYGLVCDQDILPFITLVAVLAGMPFGLYLFDFVENRFGRRAVFFGCITIQVFVGLISAWCPEVISYCIARFIIGLSFPVSHKIMLIYGLEFVGEQYRNWVLFILGICHCMGFMLVALIVHLIRNWQTMTYVTTIPFAIYYLYYWWLPESPRYLVSRGQYDEAVEIYDFIARMNGKYISSEQKSSFRAELTKLHKPLKPPSKMCACLGLWQSGYSFQKTFLFVIVWFCNALTYLGLTCFIADLGANQQLTFFLGALVEIPAFWLTLLMKEHLDRRILIGVFMILGGIACICIWWTIGNVWLSVGLCLFGKFSVTMSLAVLSQFGGSGNPKVPPGIYLDLAGAVVHFALCLVPLVIYSIFYVRLAPMMTFAVSSIVAGICTFGLPKSLKPIYLKDSNGKVIKEDLDLRWGLCIRKSKVEPYYQPIPLNEGKNSFAKPKSNFYNRTSDV